MFMTFLFCWNCDRILNNNDLRGKIPDQLTNCLSLNFLCVFLTASHCLLLIFFSVVIEGLMSHYFVSCVRNVSYNNLSGVIPLMKNFSWFSADRYCKISSCFHWFFFIFYLSMTLTRGTFYSFLGNSLLCGDWLGSKCRPYIPKSRGVVLYLI